MENNQIDDDTIAVDFKLLVQITPLADIIASSLSPEDREEAALCGNHDLSRAIKISRNVLHISFNGNLYDDIWYKSFKEGVPEVLRSNQYITGLKIKTRHTNLDGLKTVNLFAADTIRSSCIKLNNKLETIIIESQNPDFETPTLTLDTAQVITKNCPNITTLDLCTISVYQDALDHLTNNISTLKSVRLSNVRIAPTDYRSNPSDNLDEERFFLADSHVLPILHNNKGLKSITLSGAYVISFRSSYEKAHYIRITNKVVQEIGEKFGPMLKHLELSGCENDIDIPVLISALQECKKLESVNFYNTYINDEVIQAISISCPQLRVICSFNPNQEDYTCNSGITDKGLRYLCNNSNLEEISRIGPDVIDETLIELATKLPRIKSIDLSEYSPHVTIDGVQALLSSDYLEKLHCNIMNITGDDLKTLVDKCGRYNNLAVDLCTSKYVSRELSQEDLLTLTKALEYLPSMSILSENLIYDYQSNNYRSLSFCGDSITDEILTAAQAGLKEINSSFKIDKLCIINFNPSRITAETVISLLSNCSRTKKLTLTLTDDMTGNNLKLLVKILKKLPRPVSISLYNNHQMLSETDKLTIAMLCGDNRRVSYHYFEDASALCTRSIQNDEFLEIKREYKRVSKSVEITKEGPSVTLEYVSEPIAITEENSANCCCSIS